MLPNKDVNLTALTRGQAAKHAMDDTRSVSHLLPTQYKTIAYWRKSMLITPVINISGNCEEVIHYYEDVFSTKADFA